MIMIQQIRTKVDTISATAPGDLMPIQTRLRVILRRLPKDSREYAILSQVAKHISTKPLQTTMYEATIMPYGGNVGDGVLRAQAALFM